MGTRRIRDFGTPEAKIGVSVALGVAFLSSLPLAARLDRVGIATVAWNGLLMGAFSATCWLLHGALAFPSTPTRAGLVRKSSSLLLGASLSFLYNNPAVFGLLGRGRMLDLLGPVGQEIAIGFRGIVVSGAVFLARHHIDLAARSDHERRENERLIRENLQVRLASLQERLSPHFLFNALATLRGITAEPQAKEFVSRLADVYRHLLGRDGSPTSTVREELEFLDAYVHILSVRFGGALKVDRDVDPDLLERRIPSLSLQVLVENAVKHNVVSAGRPLELGIRVRDGEAEVANGLRPRLSVEEGTGNGLGGLAQRQRLLGGAEIRVEREDGRFRVRIPLLP